MAAPLCLLTLFSPCEGPRLLLAQGQQKSAVSSTRTRAMSDCAFRLLSSAFTSQSVRVPCAVYCLSRTLIRECRIRAALSNVLNRVYSRCPGWHHRARHTSPPPNLRKRHRCAAAIMRRRVWLYFRFCLSYRDSAVWVLDV